MMIVSTDNIPGREIEALGMAKGSTIQTVNMFKDIGSGFKTIVGGELKNYNKMMDDARDIATKRMVQQAEEMGADAVVAVRFATSAIMQSAAEIMVYGTAVKVK